LGDLCHCERVALLGAECVPADLVNEASNIVINPDFAQHFDVLKHHLRGLGVFVHVGEGCC
jgi:hypothetical protein